MQPPSKLGQLNTTNWEFVQDLVTRFEDACRGGTIADLAQFLLPSGNPLRALALKELIKSDLELRWGRGKSITVEVYLKRFHELQARPQDLPALLYEEFKVRQRFDKPTLKDYERRFPEQVRALEKLIADNTGQATVAQTPSTLPPHPPDAPTTPPQPAKQATKKEAPAKSGNRPPPEVGNGYTLISPLGSGTFGQVWRAEAPGGVPSAVKIIFRPIDHEEAKRELESLAKIKELRHPFLTATTAFWRSEADKLCIAMELCDGSLRDRAKECRAAGMTSIPVPEMIGYFKEAAEALDYLHSRDLLHRDIKPDNLLLVKPEMGTKSPKASVIGVKAHLKLGDFGLVRIFESQRLNASGAGTPAYMPPEVWNGQISRHSDQYSLAVTYAELRRGKPVYSGTNMYELMVECLSRDPDLSGLDEAEQTVLRKALDKDPNKRYESCLEFAYDLEKAVAPPPPVAPPPATVTPDPGAAWDGPEQGTLLPGQVPFAPTRSRPTWKADTQPIDGQQTAPQPTRNLLPTMLLILLACVPVGYAVYEFTRPPAEPTVPPQGGEAKNPWYRLDPPVRVSLRAGETQLFTFRVDRHDFTEAVHLTFKGMPAGISLAEKDVPGDKMAIQAEVKTDYEAVPGTHTVTVQGAAANRNAEVATFKLEVLPSAVYWLPDQGWAKVPGATVKADAEGRLYYDKIDVVRDGTRFRFLLIPRRAEDTKRVETFYIMENKVTVAQFKVNAAAVEKMDRKLKSFKWLDKVGDYPKDDYPVFNVCVDDAYQFALWLNGHLPTLDQWDKAAGRFDKNPPEGPFKGSWSKDSPPGLIAVGGLPGPMACGKASNDETPFGCRDMAGNGREWTRNLDQGSLTVPQTNPPTGTLVLLRGRSFRAAQPLRFQDLIDEVNNNNQSSEDYKDTATDLGFRVVIER